jgi:hypothetical protein
MAERWCRNRSNYLIYRGGRWWSGPYLHTGHRGPGQGRKFPGAAY